MKSFVDWIVARRARLVIVAAGAALAPLLQVVSMALIALAALRRGAGDAGITAGLGTLTVLAVALAASGLGVSLAAGVATTVIAGAATFALGLGLGALARWAGRLTLTFQWLLIVSTVAVLVLSLFGPGAEGLLAPLFDEIVEMMRENGATDQQIEAFREAEPLVLGLLAAGVFTHLLGALFLASWWAGLEAGDSSFGEQFRDLRLSRTLGLPAALLVTVALVLDAPVVQNLAPLALFGFLFQGLAVVHAWAHARGWHAAVVLPVYVLLVTPVMGFVVLAVSAVGLVDNWFDLRAPLRSGA